MRAAEGETAPREDGLLAGDGLLESFSLSADRGPVRIESTSLEFEYRTGQLTYRGDVKVSQADLTLSSDVLSVTLDMETTGRPREIVAEGNVRIVNGERVATGGRAVFNQDKQTITLSEAAVLRDGPNEVAGDRVVVYLEEQRSVVEGGEDRVRAVLFPAGGPSPAPASKDEGE
jgi:lipopolysaccharide export system protein LptA